MTDGLRRPLTFQPRLLGWWIAVLFVVGSALFALGSIPPYAQRVDTRAVGLTFFVGSLFFTAAGASQFVQVLGHDSRWWRDRRRIEGWEATFVQLVGTLCFNVSTFLALSDQWTVQQENRLVWAPDAFGSIAFLVASALAWRDVAGWRLAIDTGDREWWIAMVNAMGSILFGVSAIAALTDPRNGELISVTLVNSTTFLGAACFGVGAYLLLPDRGSAGHRGPSAGRIISNG